MYDSIILVLALNGLLVLGQSYNFDPEVAAPRLSSSAPVVIQALPLRDNGTTPYRMEIRDMQADKYKWDLYILALSSFMSVNQGDTLSYYQIAGIHGAPFQSYNGVGPYARNIQSGYCAHNSILFPTWHRPYLSLFEAQMYNITMAIAAQFNDNEREEYQKAASDFRLPYWDWSLYATAGQSQFPDVFWDQTISQYGPNGVQTINNPLYSYRFHPLDSRALSLSPLNGWPETKRSPDTRYSDPPSDNSQVSSAMYYRTAQIQQRLYTIFSSYTLYNSFSNKAWASENNRNADSIESVHDLVHTYTGLGGHMTYIPLSAFDPLFFLHHANIDRLVSMWQVLNPNSWISSMQSAEQTYTAPRGTWQDGSTPLYPFLAASSGKMWTSDMARSTESFGYTYADTDIRTPSLRTTLIQKINIWYGGYSPASLSGDNGLRRRDIDTVPEKNTSATDAISFNVMPNAKAPQASQVVKDNHYTEWTARVLVNIEALNGVLGVNLFIGAPPNRTEDWGTAPNLVGTAAISGMGRNTTSEVRVSSAVPLTSALMKLLAAGDISSLDPDSVVPFLKQQLHFAVLDGSNKLVDTKLVDGLYIGVDSADVEMPASDEELPKWGAAVTRMELTG